MYGLVTTTPPATEPVSLAEAKAHLRIDHTAEDALIAVYIAAARRLTEEYTHRRWITQTLTLTLDGFPESDGPICLPVQPVASITSITYVDTDGTPQTLAGSEYQTWLATTPPLVYTSASSSGWPDTDPDTVPAVTVVFVAGELLADVPPEVKAAVLLCLGNWDENRGDQNVLIAKGLPPAARFLLDPLWTGVYS